MLTRSKVLRGYNTGYAFFTHSHDCVAEGIDFFERWARQGVPRELALPVHHTGIVTGPDSLVEAQMKAGVVSRPLSDYLQSTETVIVFRRPRGWTMEMGQRIAAAATSKVGCKYNMGLIYAQVAANTVLGRLVNRLFNNGPDRWVSARLDRKREFICSELSSWALAQQPELAWEGILAQPLNTISPQELFVDQKVFELPGF